MHKLTEKQTKLLREYVRAKRQFVWAEAFKKDQRDAVLKILDANGGMIESDGGVLWASESIAEKKNGEKRAYRCVKFEDKRL